MNVGDLVKFAGDIFAATVTHIRYGVISDLTVVTVLVHANLSTLPTNTTTFSLRELRDTAEVISAA